MKPSEGPSNSEGVKTERAELQALKCNGSAVRRTNEFGYVAQHSEIKRQNLEQASVVNHQQQQNQASPLRVSEMRKTVLLTNDDARRRSAELFIKETYAARYGARLETFPFRIVALLDSRDEPLCAAGLRFLDDGFFSERYLDAPIEEVVSKISTRAVNRSAIFEVTTLASRAPRATAEFIAQIGAFGEEAGLEWSFFTLTRRLHLMISRLGIAPTFLGEADRRRIADPERWGTYYACEPKVYAVASRRLKLSWDGFQGEERHAEAI
jgi:Thermostable hemolysin